MSWDIGKLPVAEGVPATLIPQGGDLTPSVQLTAGSEVRVAPCPEAGLLPAFCIKGWGFPVYWGEVGLNFLFHA